MTKPKPPPAKPQTPPPTETSAQSQVSDDTEMRDQTTSDAGSVPDQMETDKSEDANP